MAEPVSPVVPGLEPYEIVFGIDQPQYRPLPALRGCQPTYSVLSRWKLSDAERKWIAEGADVYVSQQTFGHPFQPSHVMISRADACGEVKDLIIEQYGLNQELDERITNK